MKCKLCGKTKGRYKDKCDACYNRERYHKSARVRASRKKATYKWIKNNKERWYEIVKKAIKKYNKKKYDKI